MASKKEMSSLPTEVFRQIDLEVFNEAYLPYLNDIWAYEVYWGGGGGGKCFAKGTKVIMYSGELKAVEDIQAGDLLMGADSTPRRVMGTTNGVGELYSVHQNKGMDYVVNEHHILCLKKSKNRVKTPTRKARYACYPEYAEISVKDYLGMTDRWKKNFLGYRVAIDYPKTNLYNKLVDPMCTGITVTPIGAGEYFGFETDGDHKFLLADGTVTHNSHFIAHKIALQMTGIAGRNLLCLREHKNDCDTSVYPEIYSALQDFDLLQYWHIVEKPTVMMECLLNGNQIKCEGMDNIEDIKSIKFKKRRNKAGEVVNSGNITDIWYEEATAEKEARSFRQFDVRLRDNVQKGRIIISFNPVNRTHFLKDMIENEWMPTGDCVVCHTTYKDNKFLPASYGAKMEAFRFTDPYTYQVYTLGAWGVLGDSFFDKNAISKRLLEIEKEQRISPPDHGDFRYDLTRDGAFVEDEPDFVAHSEGDLTVYKHPEPGHPYLFALDTAGEGSDFHAGHVVDNATGEQVAVFHSKKGPSWCVFQEYFICRYYNNAMFCPEVNFDESHVRDFKRWGYTNFYQRETPGDAYMDDYEQKVGFRTSSKTRQTMLSDLQLWANTHMELINDENTLNEMLSFTRQQKPMKGIWVGAEPGSHDDLVISLAIALQARQQCSDEITMTIGKIEGDDWDEWDLREALEAGKVTKGQIAQYRKEHGMIQDVRVFRGGQPTRRKNRYVR